MADNSNIKELPRKFRYEGMLLDDMDPTASPEEILEIYAEHYPALTTAGIEGPELTEEAIVYKFVTRIGTKGGRREPASDFTLMENIADMICHADTADDAYELPPSEALEVIA